MLKEIQKQLIAVSDPKLIEPTQHFFKEGIKTRGIKSAAVNKVVKSYYPQIDKMEKKDVFALCNDLMATGFHEDFAAGAEFAYRIHKKFEKSDFKIFDTWVKDYIDNWAKCDIFCNHTVNELIEMYPALMPEIKKWSKSKNRWVKRASAVTFILSARRGRFLDDVFEIAETLLTDPDDMVQKGYGWALKAAGEYDPQRVFDFVTKRVDKMPRTAYRYAIEKLPVDMRKKAMSL